MGHARTGLLIEDFRQKPGAALAGPHAENDVSVHRSLAQSH